MTIGGRSFTEVQFGSADETVVVPVPDSRGHGRVSIYGRLTGVAGAANLTVYGAFSSALAVNEVQSINLGNIGAADTFKLTFNAHETAAAITYSTDMTTTIRTGLESLVDFAPGDVSVAKVSNSVYTVTFTGAYAATDAGDITITSAVGFAPTGVTEDVKGGGFADLSPDLTDTAALTDAMVAVVVDQDSVFPYLVLAFDGDADPDLSAAAYITTY